jgi:hypothetical protein
VYVNCTTVSSKIFGNEKVIRMSLQLFLVWKYHMSLPISKETWDDGDFTIFNSKTWRCIYWRRNCRWLLNILYINDLSVKFVLKDHVRLFTNNSFPVSLFNFVRMNARSQKWVKLLKYSGLYHRPLLTASISGLYVILEPHLQ